MKKSYFIGNVVPVFSVVKTMCVNGSALGAAGVRDSPPSRALVSKLTFAPY